MCLVCIQLQEQNFEKKYLTKVMEISNNYYATISFRGMCTVRNISTTFQYFDVFLYVGDKIKPLQNKKNLGYPRKKQSFYKEKDCVFLGYPKFFWRFLFWNGFSDIGKLYILCLIAENMQRICNLKSLSTSLKQFIQSLKGQNNFENRIHF